MARTAMNNNISPLKTDSSLLEALKAASTRKITKEELQEQKASFVFGVISSSSSVTKAQVKQFLEERD